MRRMQPSPEPEDERPPLLVTRDPERAEQWAGILAEAGIDAGVEITDAQVVAPGSSPLVGVLGARPLDFVHVVTVSRTDREAAVAALVDAGWDGQEGMQQRRTPSLRRMALAVVLVASVLFAFLAVRAGIG